VKAHLQCLRRQNCWVPFYQIQKFRQGKIEQLFFNPDFPLDDFDRIN